MLYKNIVMVACAGCALLSALPAHPDGCYFPSESKWRQQREKSLINEPDQKALVYFDKGVEQLVISPSYSGEASDFAWVVPVPSRPEIKILQGAPFHELARIAEPEPPMYRAKSRNGSFAAGRPAAVTVIERKTIGDYDVTVLAATDSTALVRWLRDNQYHLPQAAVGPIGEYIKEGWTFVASKIKLQDKATGLKTGTLTPLRLVFKSPGPVYPMRLSAVNPEPFSLLVYVALPQEQPTAGPFTFKAIKYPANSNPALKEVTLSASQREAYPTLARLSRGGMTIYWMKARISPSNCDRDYVWASTTR